jgi:LytR cell envelope-related transcriptional attenuator
MTALSPMGRVPRRRPVPPRVRRRRRPGPWLALLGVLLVITVVVWWRVLGTASRTNANACGPRPSAVIATMSTKSVQVRVFNSTDKDGLAKTVSDALTIRGFTVLTATNDPLQSRTVTGVGEIRYGPQGTQQALLLGFQFPGASMMADSRTGAVVDVAIGPGYTRIANAAEISQARLNALAKVGSGGNGC